MNNNQTTAKQIERPVIWAIEWVCSDPCSLRDGNRFMFDIAVCDDDRPEDVAAVHPICGHMDIVSMRKKDEAAEHKNCGGTILGGNTGCIDEYSYCDRCHAFRYRVFPGLCSSQLSHARLFCLLIDALGQSNRAATTEAEGIADLIHGGVTSDGCEGYDEYDIAVHFCERHCVRWTRDDRRDATRYTMADDSVIVVAGGGWDLALDPDDDECYCWEGCGEHYYECLASNSIEELDS